MRQLTHAMSSEEMTLRLPPSFGDIKGDTLHKQLAAMGCHDLPPHVLMPLIELGIYSLNTVLNSDQTEVIPNLHLPSVCRGTRLVETNHRLALNRLTLILGGQTTHSIAVACDSATELSRDARRIHPDKLIAARNACYLYSDVVNKCTKDEDLCSATLSCGTRKYIKPISAKTMQPTYPEWEQLQQGLDKPREQDTSINLYKRIMYADGGMTCSDNKHVISVFGTPTVLHSCEDPEYGVLSRGQEHCQAWQ